MRTVLVAALLTQAHADTLTISKARYISNQWHPNTDTRLPGTTISSTCTATGLRTHVTTNTNNNTRPECDQSGHPSFSGESCNSECCAAYTNVAYGGFGCSGQYCALSSAGNYGGANCMGYRCAAYSSSGCPAYNNDGLDSCTSCNPQFSSEQYTDCCTDHQGAGCIGNQCALLCNGNRCGTYCLQNGCAMNCTGQECGAWCQGDQCAINCFGNNCGSQCWGTECAQNCTGPHCGSTCTRDRCAQNCSHDNCGEFCIGDSCSANCQGADCGNACLGDNCAKNCSGTRPGETDDGHKACGVQSVGSYSAYGCYGHGCGKHCVGDYCASYAASNFTESRFANPPESPQEATNCFNEWIARVMGIKRSVLHTSAPVTAAPTLAPTVPSVAPTLSPTAQPSAAPSQAPTSANRLRQRRTLDDDDAPVGPAFDNNTCPLIATPIFTSPDHDMIAEGPAHHCNGYRCGHFSKGLFAASFCSGEECGRNASGLYAAVGCTGTYCGRLASGPFASAYCYGKWCASDANGDWSGSYCIGNECALSATGAHSGLCCVGLNCTNHSNTDDCAESSNNGAPLGLGDSHIYSAQCRPHVDTESAEWKNFSAFCARGPHPNITSYTPYSACHINCTTELSAFLRFYAIRASGESYGVKRRKYSVRWQQYQSSLKNDDDNDEEAYMISTYVLVGVIGTVIIGLIARGVFKAVGKSSYMYSTLETKSMLNSM